MVCTWVGWLGSGGVAPNSGEDCVKWVRSVKQASKQTNKQTNNRIITGSHTPLGQRPGEFCRTKTKLETLGQSVEFRILCEHPTHPFHASRHPTHPTYPRLHAPRPQHDRIPRIHVTHPTQPWTTSPRIHSMLSPQESKTRGGGLAAPRALKLFQVLQGPLTPRGGSLPPALPPFFHPSLQIPRDPLRPIPTPYAPLPEHLRRGPEELLTGK